MHKNVHFISKKTCHFIWAMAVFYVFVLFFSSNFANRAESLNFKYVPVGCDFVGSLSIQWEKLLDTQMVVSHLVRTWCESDKHESSWDWQAASPAFNLSSGGCLIPVGLINAALKPRGSFIPLPFVSDFWYICRGGLLQTSEIISAQSFISSV